MCLGLGTKPHDARTKRLESEQRRLQTEIDRLTAALAAGGALASLLDAIRQRERQLETLALDLDLARAAAGALELPLDVIMPEVRRRLTDWQLVLTEESAQSRQMLRSLLRGRLVFTPLAEPKAVRIAGEGDVRGLFEGLIDSQALASPRGNTRFSLTEIRRSLRETA